MFGKIGAFFGATTTGDQASDQANQTGIHSATQSTKQPNDTGATSDSQKSNKPNYTGPGLFSHYCDSCFGRKTKDVCTAERADRESLWAGRTDDWLIPSAKLGGAKPNEITAITSEHERLTNDHINSITGPDEQKTRDALIQFREEQYGKWFGKGTSDEGKLDE